MFTVLLLPLWGFHTGWTCEGVGGELSIESCSSIDVMKMGF
jgi:hypothetical protein